MIYNPNIDPTYLFKRDKTEYLHVIENKPVNHSGITLKEIPDHKSNFSITDKNGAQLTEVFNQDVKNRNNFRVDYTTGVVYFHSSRNGETVDIDYFGTGMISMPTSRIFLPSEYPDPLESLEDALNKVDEGVNILSQIGSLKFLGEFDNNFEYAKWNFVFKDGTTYVALENVKGEDPSNSDKWQIISSGMEAKGTYNSLTVYKIGEIVSDRIQQNLYMSKKDKNTSPLSNDSDWEKLISVENVIRDTVDKIEELEQLRLTVSSSLESINRLIAEIESSEDERMQNEQARHTSDNERDEHFSDLILEMGNISENAKTTIERINHLHSQTTELINDINAVLDRTTEVAESVDEASNEFEQMMKSLSEWKMAGEYDDETEYKRFNMVHYERSLYQAVQDTAGNDPSNEYYWSMMAQHGRDGDGLISTIDGISPNDIGDFSLDTTQIVRSINGDSGHVILDFDKLGFTKTDDFNLLNEKVYTLSDNISKIGDPTDFPNDKTVIQILLDIRERVAVLEEEITLLKKNHGEDSEEG